MKRIRAVAIVMKGDEVLLMYRKNEKEYFNFPGGKMEDKETIEQAVLRELREETTIEAKIKKLLYIHKYDDNSEQYFYLCEYISGEPKLGDDSEEKEEDELSLGKDFHKPLWVKLEKIENMLIYPLEIKDLLIKDFENNFRDSVKEFNIKVSELRQSIV
ncbi:MAG: NUDIX domain-containing protein [Burkholderiales bacterium]|nr:NUDIX domain-containing protein [Burkholderiales bacterium]